MELSVILTTLLHTFATGSPDLCDDVYLDSNGVPYTDAVGQTWSRFCEWAGPDAPKLDANICCTLGGNGASCGLPDANGRCWSGELMYCGFGEVYSTREVVCMQPLLSACDLGFCTDIAPPDIGSVEDALCCWDAGCIEVETVDDLKYCSKTKGYSGFCKNGAQNDDGTIDCFD